MVHELLHFDSRKNEAFVKNVFLAILGQQDIIQKSGTMIRYRMHFITTM